MTAEEKCKVLWERLIKQEEDTKFWRERAVDFEADLRELKVRYKELLKLVPVGKDGL